LVLTKVGDDEGKVLGGFKTSYLHPTKTTLVYTDAGCVNPGEKRSLWQVGAFPFGENHRKNCSAASGDEVKVLAVAARYRTDVAFENFKSGESLLNDLQQSSVLSAEVFADLVRRIGDLGIVVILNRAKEVIAYSKVQDAGD